MVPPLDLALPASITAFSSAWIQRQESKLTPDGAFELHLSQPPSLQLTQPKGVPLYPVEIILKSLTITAPTARFMQFERVATTSASLRKYVSHFGLICSSLAKSMSIEDFKDINILLSYSWRCFRECSSVPLLTIVLIILRSLSSAASNQVSSESFANSLKSD